MPKWFEVENHALKCIAKDFFGVVVNLQSCLEISYCVGNLLDHHLRDIKGERNMLLVIMQLHIQFCSMSKHCISNADS